MTRRGVGDPVACGRLLVGVLLAADDDPAAVGPVLDVRDRFTAACVEKFESVRSRKYSDVRSLRAATRRTSSRCS